MMLEKASKDADHENSVLRAEIAQLRSQLNTNAPKNHNGPAPAGQRGTSNFAPSTFSTGTAPNRTEAAGTEIPKRQPTQTEPTSNDAVNTTETNQSAPDFSFRFPSSNGLQANTAFDGTNRQVSLEDPPYNIMTHTQPVSNATSTGIPGYIAPGILSRGQPNKTFSDTTYNSQYDEQLNANKVNSTRSSPRGSLNAHQNNAQLSTSSNKSSSASNSPGSSRSYNTEQDSHSSVSRNEYPHTGEYSSYKNPMSSFDQAADLAFLSNVNNNTTMDTGRRVDSSANDQNDFKITDVNNYYSLMSSLSNNNNDNNDNLASGSNDLSTTMNNPMYSAKQPAGLGSVATSQPTMPSALETNPSQFSQTQQDSLLFPSYVDTQEQLGQAGQNKSSPFLDWLASRNDDNNTLLNTFGNISDPIIPTSLGPDYFSDLTDPTFPPQDPDASLVPKVAATTQDTVPTTSAAPVEQSVYPAEEQQTHPLIEMCDRAVWGQQGEKEGKMADKYAFLSPQQKAECSRIWYVLMAFVRSNISRHYLIANNFLLLGNESNLCRNSATTIST